MVSQLARVLNETDLAGRLTSHGLKTIRARHTCAHRVDELLSFIESPLELAVSAGRN